MIFSVVSIPLSGGREAFERNEGREGELELTSAFSFSSSFRLFHTQIVYNLFITLQLVIAHLIPCESPSSEPLLS